MNKVEAKLNGTKLSFVASIENVKGSVKEYKTTIDKKSVSNAKNYDEFRKCLVALGVASSLHCDSQAKKAGECKNTNYDGIARAGLNALGKVFNNDYGVITDKAIAKRISLERVKAKKSKKPLAKKVVAKKSLKTLKKVQKAIDKVIAKV